MTRIVHLTDLHFGHEHAGMVGSLLDCVNRQAADLVVVTGDLTHRARPGQFADASAFLARIEAPTLVVPGNHDIPLYNLVSRFLWPWSGYCRATNMELSPMTRVGDILIQGINSVNPYSWRRGILRSKLVERAIRRIDPAAVNIIALHHPMQEPEHTTKGLARNAEVALTKLEEAGVQLILSGHLHRWASESLLAVGPHMRVLQINSGTALCARPGDPPNEFAVLDFGDASVLTVTRYRAMNGVYDPDHDPEIISYSRASGYWQIVG